MLRTRVIFGDIQETLSGLDLKGKGLLCSRRRLNLKIADLDLDLLPVSPEPTIDDIRKYHVQIREKEYDYVLAIGGGSVIDTAKILAALMTNDGDPADFVGEDRIKNDIKTLIAVPTTHGSGSEVTKYAVIKFSDAKRSVVSDKICPHFAILDVNLVMGLPRDLTLYTSIDAFCHNVESYFTKFATPLVNVVCEQGMKKFFEGIDGAMEDSKPAREKMMLCSLLGGIAITWGQAYLIHALSHVIGARLDLPHGMANALFLPGFIKFFRAHPKMGELQRVLGVDVEREIESIYERYGVRSLSDFVTENEAMEIAEDAFKNRRLMGAGQRETTLEELKEMVRFSL